MKISEKYWYKDSNYFKFKEFCQCYKKEGQGSVILLLHGFPTSSWDFANIWNSLSEIFQIIAPDLLGLGRSSKDFKEISVLTQADCIESLIVNLGVVKCHIIAHDLGDTITQELIARQIDSSLKFQICSCIMLNGGLFPETHRPRMIQKLLISPIGFLIAKLTSYSTFKNNMRAIFGEYPPSNEFLENSWELLIANKGKKVIPKLANYMSERHTYRERWVNALIRSRIPLRLVNGNRDPISGINMTNRYEELIPSPDIALIKESGHYPHVEHPNQVIDAILDFYNAHGITK